MSQVPLEKDPIQYAANSASTVFPSNCSVTLSLSHKKGQKLVINEKISKVNLL